VETTLLEAYNMITKLLDACIPVALIFLDLAKLFDKVPHRRFHIKVLSASLKQTTANRLICCLTNYMQRVILFGSIGQKIYPKLCTVISHVPKGRVFDRTLFRIYINYIVTGFSNNIILFADDFKFFGLADSLSLQADLNHIQKRAERWLPSFNISKCSVLHFGPKNENTVYSMWNPDKLTKIDLQTHNEERALGVLAPNQLKFHFQARNVVSKSNARHGLLKRSISNRSP